MTMIAAEQQVVLGPHHRQTAADVAAEALFDAVLAGVIKPGSALRLQQIADQLGMSVMPVREALRKLDGLGLVELQPHRGAWLRPLTRDDLLDTYFTRVSLELLAVRQAARNFSDRHAAIARAALDEQQLLKDRGDRVGARVAHERFHFALYEASGSMWLMRSILPAWRNAERYRVMAMRFRGPSLARHEEHLGLLQALIDRDESAAVDQLLRHLETSIRTGLEAVSAQADGDGDTAGDVASGIAELEMRLQLGDVFSRHDGEDGAAADDGRD